MEAPSAPVQCLPRQTLLLKIGELTLKGLNRGTFEDVLLRNLRRALAPLGAFRCFMAQSTIVVEAGADAEEDEKEIVAGIAAPAGTKAAAQAVAIDWDAAARRVGQIFGVAAYTRAWVVDKNMDTVLTAAIELFRAPLQKAKTFKVEAKRSDKRFPLTSPQICAAAGEALLKAYPHLRVDVHLPETTVWIEVRDRGLYLHGAQQPGAGGLPVGTGGRALVLLSGGIDSPVAAWRMAKRGLTLTAVHFASPPYTSEFSLQKVVSLCEKLRPFTGRMELLVVPFTEIQEGIRRSCPDELLTLVMRRMMMRIAATLAKEREIEALVTGESLGQVASQTLPALRCTEAVTDLPVLRPLIGMDKEEIIATARQIDTFEISIQPHEDCCTVFTPRHPRTHPKLAQLEAAEAALPIGEWVAAATGGTYAYRNTRI